MRLNTGVTVLRCDLPRLARANGKPHGIDERALEGATLKKAVGKGSMPASQSARNI
jgi:hypothetical protein